MRTRYSRSTVALLTWPAMGPVAPLANLETACAAPGRPCFGDSAGIAAVTLRELEASANVGKHKPASSVSGGKSDRQLSASASRSTGNLYKLL